MSKNTMIKICLVISIPNQRYNFKLERQGVGRCLPFKNVQTQVNKITLRLPVLSKMARNKATHSPLLI